MDEKRKQHISKMLKMVEEEMNKIDSDLQENIIKEYDGKYDIFKPISEQLLQFKKNTILFKIFF